MRRRRRRSASSWPTPDPRWCASASMFRRPPRRGLRASDAYSIQSTDLAIESGLRKDQIIISCKTSRPRDLIAVYRELARQTDQPLHLGLTEAGMGVKGLVWSASAMGVLLTEGIGDTIRVSLTPRPGGDRREEGCPACDLL